MKVTTTLNLENIITNLLDNADSSQLIELYHFFDEVCVEAEEELIRIGVWESDE